MAIKNNNRGKSVPIISVLANWLTRVKQEHAVQEYARRIKLAVALKSAGSGQVEFTRARYNDDVIFIGVDLSRGKFAGASAFDPDTLATISMACGRKVESYENRGYLIDLKDDER